MTGLYKVTLCIHLFIDYTETPINTYIYQEKCEDDLLKVEVERDQKMTELAKKEETALLKKDAEISRLRAEMTAKENVSTLKKSDNFEISFHSFVLHLIYCISI